MEAGVCVCEGERARERERERERERCSFQIVFDLVGVRARAFTLCGCASLGVCLFGRVLCECHGCHNQLCYDLASVGGER